jgi:hypothetical protein
MSSNNFFNATTCQIGNEVKTGKVLAIAAYTSDRRVCFQVEGEKGGTWVPETAILIAEDKIAAEQEQKDPREEGQEVATQEVNALQNLAAELKDGLENQASEYVHTITRIAKHTQELATETAKEIAETFEAGVNAGDDLLDQIRQWLDRFVGSLRESIQSYGEIWQKRIWSAIKNIETPKAQEEVANLKNQYPQETPQQIADRLIQEKALFSTLTSLTDNSENQDTLFVNWMATAPMLSELIYQVGVCYGFEKINEHELLATFAVVHSKERLEQLNAGFLQNQSSDGSNIPVKASSNTIAFHAIGYAASQYFESKVKKLADPLTTENAYTELNNKLEALLERELSQQEVLENTLREALQLKEKLPIQ